MRTLSSRMHLAACVAAAVASAHVLAAQASHSSPALRIVVIEGEAAVNIIQQKTAVAPVVEVRDRNDQPVAGAVVHFVVQSGRASFSGARTLAVTTGGSGRAVAQGFMPTGTGALKISATASFQGETAAAVTIAQTAVATAAQAAGAATAGAAAGGASAGGAVSATTLAVVGAGVGGAAIATKTIVDKAKGGGGGGGATYMGNYSATIRQTVPVVGACSRDELHQGTIVLQVDISDTGGVSGNAQVQGTYSVVSYNPPGQCLFPPGQSSTSSYGVDSIPVAGANGSVTFNRSLTYSDTNATITPAFTGTRNGDQITGTYTETWLQLPSRFGGSMTAPVAFAKQ